MHDGWGPGEDLRDRPVGPQERSWVDRLLSALVVALGVTAVVLLVLYAIVATR